MRLQCTHVHHHALLLDRLFGSSLPRNALEQHDPLRRSLVGQPRPQPSQELHLFTILSTQTLFVVTGAPDAFQKQQLIHMSAGRSYCDCLNSICTLLLERVQVHGCQHRLDIEKVSKPQFRTKQRCDDGKGLFTYCAASMSSGFSFNSLLNLSCSAVVHNCFFCSL